MRFLCIAAAVSFACASAPTRPALAVSQGTKQDDIRHLLRMTGSDKLGVQLAKDMLASMRKMSTDKKIPEEFFVEFEKELRPETLVELTVPIYDSRFTHDEILELIAFYETPIGRKSIAETPGIAQEAQLIGKDWGRRAAEAAMRRVLGPRSP